MRPFSYARADQCPRVQRVRRDRRRRRAARRRPVPRRRHHADRPDEARRDAAGARDRHQRLALAGYRRSQPDAGPAARRAGAHGRRRRPPACAARLSGDRRGAGSSPPARSFATWPASAATSCSGRAAPTSATRYAACNKREPGSGCAALDGFNRMHAVLGTSEHCIASYPGDFAQALVALDADVEIAGRRAPARFRSRSCTALPGDHAATSRPTLEPGELITGFDVPAGAWSPAVAAT